MKTMAMRTQQCHFKTSPRVTLAKVHRRNVQGCCPQMLKIKPIWKESQSVNRRKINWHKHSVTTYFKMNKHVLHIKT